MSTAEPSEFAEILDRVNSWPPGQRLRLTRRILELLGNSASDDPIPRGGPTAEEVRSLLAIDRPAPDDQTTRRWIDEHRLEKYGR